MSLSSVLSPRKVLIAAIVCLNVALVGCGYLPPSRSLPVEKQQPLFKAPTRGVAATATQTPEAVAPNEPTQIPNCTNDLEYIADLSIPDGTQLDPNSVIEKEWQVKNNGSCNWNNAYTLRLVSGSALGVEPTQALVPARNGTEAIIRIEFTTPAEPGKYEATWQAFGPNGEAFGEWLTIQIGVTTP